MSLEKHFQNRMNVKDLSIDQSENKQESLDFKKEIPKMFWEKRYQTLMERYKLKDLYFPTILAELTILDQETNWREKIEKDIGKPIDWSWVRSVFDKRNEIVFETGVPYGIGQALSLFHELRIINPQLAKDISSTDYFKKMISEVKERNERGEDLQNKKMSVSSWAYHAGLDILGDDFKLNAYFQEQIRELLREGTGKMYSAATFERCSEARLLNVPIHESIRKIDFKEIAKDFRALTEKTDSKLLSSDAHVREYFLGEYFDFASKAKLLMAKKISFTNNGIEIIIPSEKENLTGKEPALPIKRKF